MRILILNPAIAYIRGGAEINDLGLGKAFKSLGHEIIHVDAIDTKKRALGYEKNVRTESVQMRFFLERALRTKGLFGMILRNLFYFIFTLKVMAQKRNLLLDSDLILLTGKPILTIIKIATKAVVLYSVRGASRSFSQLFYSLVDGIIFWGGCEADQPKWLLERRCSVLLDPAIENNIFYPRDRDEKLRNKMTENITKCVLLTYTGRFDPVKQLGRLINAALFLAKKGIQFRLLLIGDGSERSRLEEQSSSLRGDKILFLGTMSRDEIAEYLRVTDIFVLCSRNENHPISLKEAIACGTYSIAPAIGRIPYLIEESKCGETYSPNDQETLNKTLLRGIKEKRYVRDRKVGGLHVILNTWEDSAREIISFVDSINSS